MPAVAAKPAALDDMVAEGSGDAQWEAAGPGRVSLPSLKVPRQTLRSFPHSKRVGSYLVGKMINKGSFAKVMEGLHVGTGEKVAIKVIDKKKARQDSYVLKNMKREPRIHQMIQHPNIVVLLETLETENSFYMVMELCTGGDLMDRICDKRRLEEREVRRYTRQILSAVDHLHKHGVVHRDLKIENFLLDEHNNIKIVDFGLSNTLKTESLSPELLSTQCGSPAYAAPELLAHREYGPKVDVWSVGVSTFAMLTGALPFTVEPFNIKQLHQKMVNREFGSIPSDVSKGATTFVMSLLEPEPDKRLSVRAAMEDKWINEGYAKKPLHTLSYKNRLHAEDLNACVLAYMTEMLNYSQSEITNTVTANRPSAIMASYHLLLLKLSRSQRGTKAAKKSDGNNCSPPNKMTGREENRTEEPLQQAKVTSEKVSKQAGRTLGAQQTADPSSRRRLEEVQRKAHQMDAENRPPLPSLPQSSRPTSPPTTSRLSSAEKRGSNGDPSIMFAGRGTLIPEVLPLRDKDLVHAHAASSKSPPSQLNCDSAPCQVPLHDEPTRESSTLRPIRYTHLLRTTQSDGAADQRADCFQEQHPQGLTPLYFSEKNKVSPRVLPEAEDQPSSERDHLDRTRTSTSAALPRICHVASKEVRVDKVMWTSLSRPRAPGLLVNGSKPLTFPSQRQHTLVIKSLRQEKSKRKELLSPGQKGRGGGEKGEEVRHATKRNSVLLRSSLQRRTGDLNLPLLPATMQEKVDKKNNLHSAEY